MANQTEHGVAGQRQFLRIRYAGHHIGAAPAEDAGLTHVEQRSPSGEYLRRN